MTISVIVLLNIVTVLCVEIRDRVVYPLSGSPYHITDDIVIQTTGHLVLTPGVTLNFDPGVGIIVRGVITAEVRMDICKQTCKS